MTAGSKPPLVTAASVTRESIAVGLLGKKKVDAPAAVGGGEEGGEWRDGLLATLLRPLHEARPRRPSADEADPRNLAPPPSEAGAGGEPGGEAAADAAEAEAAARAPARYPPVTSTPSYSFARGAYPGASGLKWRDVGGSRPQTGAELKSPKQAAACAHPYPLRLPFTATLYP